ncbi:WD40 repeat protein [Streptomyces achromogenes]|uniref:hypothetical protein n=1 Tax=Streptomyces achromogenes TaxID=67255 RepID=UPI00277FA70C|nr:hypothetical protein [Streptomyces achromogenes]MDQ0828178.1 WD40 repeat protein [Streptomyces achromogenes]
MTTSAAPDGTPPRTTAPGTGDETVGAFPRGGVELFPVNFTAYRHHEDLDTDRHVKAVADLLADYGVRTTEWTVLAGERDLQAVEDRLRAWRQPTAAGGHNTLLYWVGHGTAERLAHHRTPSPIDDGVSPQAIAHAIGSRQLHPDNDGSWAIVVLDACFSTSFARAVHRELFDDKHAGVRRYLLLATAAQGYAELGAFSRALERALNVTFPTQRAIGLSALGRELAGDLDGFFDDLTVDDHRDQLVSLRLKAASSVSAPLDQLAEVQAVIDQLPDDERRHFLPKATGAELGELAWYFHGRTLQRDQILNWLNAASNGALVVTGPAGAGKSALLGHVLLHTNSSLRDILIRHGHLTPLPPCIPCPNDPFDLVTHLAGLTPARVLHLVAHAAGLTDLATLATDGQPPADLTARLLTELRERPTQLTLLFDGLDETEQPLHIADQILRPLAALPTVRLIIGTRRSTREGPDHPTLDDTNILDTLGPHPATLDRPATVGPQYVEVSRDPEAIAGYLRAKLHAAKHQGTLNADYRLIEEAVRRLVTDQQQDGAEPQQFLYARLAVHELLNAPRLLADPTPLTGQTHRQLFNRALERLHHVNPHYTHLLKALGLAQGRGLPDQDDIWSTIANALAPGPAQTRDSIPSLLHDAAPYLALDQEHGQSVYRLAHRTFTEHFTTTDTNHAHAAITTALARHTRHTLRRQGTPDAASQPADVSPYTRHHLITHARLGHAAGALHTLADHPDVLDTLALAGITTNALHHGLNPDVLPPAIAGTVLFQHHAQEIDSDQQDHDTLGWRRWWRRLGTTYIQGTPPPTEPHPHNTRPWPLTLRSGTVAPRRLHLQLPGQTGRVWAVAVFTALDGTPRLATGSDDGKLRIWNPATGTQDGQILTGHRGGVWAVAVFTALDGTPRLATGGPDRTVRIWNPATGTQDGQPLNGHDRWVWAVAVFTAPDGTPRLASASGDWTVRIWNPATGTQEGQPLTGHNGGVRGVAVFTAPDGTPRLAAGHDDGTVRVWNPATGTQDGPALTGHRGGVWAVVVFTAPDGTPRLASACGNGTVRIWNPATGAPKGRPLSAFLTRVWAVVVFTAPDGTPRLATGHDDGVVRIWNLATGVQEGQILTGHRGGVWAVAVFTAPDGTPRLASASNDDSTVWIWNPATDAQEGQILTGHDGGVTVAAVFTALDGTPRLATGHDDGVVRIWNPATGTQESQILPGQTGRVWAVAVFTALDGTARLAAGHDDGKLRIWNPATSTQEGQPLTGHTDWVTAVAVFTAPDGTPRLASASGDATVRIWNPATGTQDGPALTGHNGRVRGVAVFTAPDGTPRLASASDDGTVRIWNPATGTQEGQLLTDHLIRVWAVAVFTGPDGTPRLASASGDWTVRIWNPATGAQEGQPLTGHNGGVRGVAVFTAPDGTPRLASASDDGTVRIWNPRTRTGHMLLSEDAIRALIAGHDLLVIGTSSGHLVIDVSSEPTDTP